MNSIEECGTLSEFWTSVPNSNSLYSHCAVSPTIMMHQAILGLGHDSRGNLRLRPQLGDLEAFAIKSKTPDGWVEFTAKKEGEGHRCSLVKPEGMPISIRLSRECEDMPLMVMDTSGSHEFGYDATNYGELEFMVYPYPRNKLIREFASK